MCHTDLHCSVSVKNYTTDKRSISMIHGISAHNRCVGNFDYPKTYLIVSLCLSPFLLEARDGPKKYTFYATKCLFRIDGVI